MHDLFMYVIFVQMDSKRLSKHRSAVGLSYSTGSDLSPTIAVKGDRLEADEIVRLARRFGIPVVEKKQLAMALRALNIDESVPSELFEAVALVIAQVDKRIK